MINKNGYGKVAYGVNDDAEIIGLKDIGKETIKKLVFESMKLLILKLCLLYH